MEDHVQQRAVNTQFAVVFDESHFAETIHEEAYPAAIDRGKLFRRVNKVGKAWGEGITEKAVWHIVRSAQDRWYREIGAA
jgi:hypothetical protein